MAEAANGVAPIKLEYRRKEGRILLDILSDKKGHEDTPASPASKVAPEQKSKRRMKKELQERRAAGLCNHIVQGGSCPFAERCRFNHDIVKYLASKDPDLPGACPFSASPTCPFGIQCRYASRHSAAQQQQVLQPTAGITASAPASGAAEAEGAAGEGDADLPAATGSEAACTPASRGADAQEPAALRGSSLAVVQNGIVVEDPAPGTDATAGDSKELGTVLGSVLQLPGPARAGGQGNGSIPEGVLELPVQAQADAPTANVLDKGLQAKLRKSTYDFARAQEVLDRMGIKASRQYTKLPRNKGGSGQSSPHQNGADHASNGAHVVEAAAGHIQGEGHANSPKGAAVEAGEHTNIGMGTEAAMVDANALGSAPIATSAEVFTQEQQPGAKRQRVDGGAGVRAHTDGMEVTVEPPVALFDAARQCKEEARTAHVEVPLRARERKLVDFRGKLYLAPLTTVGNLPFRRVCKMLGADVTCGEMALAANLLQGHAAEWALLKRHPCEDLFGVQVCGGYADAMAHTAQLLEDTISADFVDVNMGCPIDLICDKGAGSSLLLKPARIEQIARSMSSLLTCPLTIKVRKGYYDGADNTHTWISQAPSWGVTAATLHGRTRQQRYSKQADWAYIGACAAAAPGLQLIGNGDILSFTEYNERMAACPQLATVMLARGALVKPWLFTEIKEQRHWDISAGERLDLLRDFCSAGLLHWGSDTRGVEGTRRFLLEWISFTHRYCPVALLEVVPQRLHWRAPAYVGRSDLETLLASDRAADWVRISEMLLGPAPAEFRFTPKHKAKTYASTEGAMAFESEGLENG